MKRVFLILFSLGAGVAFTFLVLNRENIHAKEEYLVYAFQAGAFESYDNASNYVHNLPSSIIVNENNLYKVYVGIYKNIDIVNKMLVYFEDNNIHIYLKNINVTKDFYNIIDNYEVILNGSTNELVYNKTNQSILNLYLESVK